MKENRNNSQNNAQNRSQNNQKSNSKGDRLTEPFTGTETQDPAVPNRAHTQMSKDNKSNSSAKNSKNCK